MGLGETLLATTPLTQAESPPSVRASASPERVREVAEDFEAFFVAQMLDYMFSDISTDGVFGGGPSEGLYRSMLNQEYAKSMVRAGGIGIADSVEREILKLQEAK